MTIHQIAERLNEKSIEDDYRIDNLPELRKLHLNKKQLPAKIFTNHTIFDGEHRYAFHHGGRDEMQFNVGEEEVDGGKVKSLSVLIIRFVKYANVPTTSPWMPNAKFDLMVITLSTSAHL